MYEDIKDPELRALFIQYEEEFQKTVAPAKAAPSKQSVQTGGRRTMARRPRYYNRDGSVRDTCWEYM